MKKSNKCPKCENDKIMRGTFGMFGSTVAIFGNTTEMYICKECGFTELYTEVNSIVESHFSDYDKDAKYDDTPWD